MRYKEARMTPYIMLVVAVSAGWALVVVLLLVLQHYERKELYSRLMARDLPEYEATKSTQPTRSRNIIKKNIDRHKPGGD
jgi:uncharacterized membrane protein